MDRFQREALDRHITGNYGEDQFRYDGPEDDGQDDSGPLAPDICGEMIQNDGDSVACPQQLPCPVHGPADNSHRSSDDNFQRTYDRLTRQHGRNAGSNLFTSIYLGEARDV